MKQFEIHVIAWELFRIHGRVWKLSMIHGNAWNQFMDLGNDPAPEDLQSKMFDQGGLVGGHIKTIGTWIFSTLHTERSGIFRQFSGHFYNTFFVLLK